MCCRDVTMMGFRWQCLDSMEGWGGSIGRLRGLRYRGRDEADGIICMMLHKLVPKYGVIMGNLVCEVVIVYYMLFHASSMLSVIN